MRRRLMLGDCLQRMAEIEDGSVDMVMTDPPYGTTACKWDSVIDLDKMWEHLKRLIKPNGAIVLMASQPFTTTLISSNMNMFKYCWVWDKQAGLGFLDVKFRPMKFHEDISIWSFGGCSNGSKIPMKYNPQGLVQTNKTNRWSTSTKLLHSKPKAREFHNVKTGYPKSVLRFPRVIKGLHPTQKPVALMEYMINTYTNAGDTVLDFAMGSGTTGVACKHLHRRFIGIEKDKGYYRIARDRIKSDNGSMS